MKGTHMSERDLIYRDLSCWPTPLHYHPAYACGPFYLTLLHSLPPCLPTHPLSIYVSVCLSVTKWICNHIKDLFFHFFFRSKRDISLIVRNSFCAARSPSLSQQVQVHLCLPQLSKLIFIFRCRLFCIFSKTEQSLRPKAILTKEEGSKLIIYVIYLSIYLYTVALTVMVIAALTFPRGWLYSCLW